MLIFRVNGRLPFVAQLHVLARVVSVVCRDVPVLPELLEDSRVAGGMSMQEAQKMLVLVLGGFRPSGGHVGAGT